MKRKTAARSCSVPHARLGRQLKASRRIATYRVPLDIYTIPAGVIAKQCGVSIDRAERWKLGTSHIPYTAAVLLYGYLEAMAPEWNGWRIKGDTLISPKGEVIGKATLTELAHEAKQQGCSIEELAYRVRQYFLDL